MNPHGYLKIVKDNFITSGAVLQRLEGDVHAYFHDCFNQEQSDIAKTAIVDRCRLLEKRLTTALNMTKALRIGLEKT